jgi:hypothetical protein
MLPVPPQWFKLRQGKLEQAGSEYMVRLTAPNQNEAFIRIEPTPENRWRAALRLVADGPDIAVTPNDFPRPVEAWEAAFELYRGYVIN